MHTGRINMEHVVKIINICPCNKRTCLTVYEFDDGSIWIKNEKNQEILISPDDWEDLKRKIKEGEL